MSSPEFRVYLQSLCQHLGSHVPHGVPADVQLGECGVAPECIEYNGQIALQPGVCQRQRGEGLERDGRESDVRGRRKKALTVSVQLNVGFVYIRSLEMRATANQTCITWSKRIQRFDLRRDAWKVQDSVRILRATKSFTKCPTVSVCTLEWRRFVWNAKYPVGDSWEPALQKQAEESNQPPCHEKTLHKLCNHAESRVFQALILLKFACF